MEQIDDTVADMKKRYGISHCNVTKEEADGEVAFVLFEIRFKVKKGKKVIDISR